MTHIFIIEWVASTVSYIMANRFPPNPLPYAVTDLAYDEDYNQLDSTTDGPHETPIYYGPTGMIPAEVFEKLFRLLCSQPHQILMLFHQMIQGILSVFKKIKSSLFS